MAGKKGSKGSDGSKQLEFVFGADTKKAEDGLKSLEKSLDSTVKTVEKLNTSLEKTVDGVKKLSKVATDNTKTSIKLANEKAKAEQKAADEKIKAEQRAQKEAERAAEKEYKTKLKYQQDIRKNAVWVQDQIAKTERDNLKKAEKAQKDYIDSLKKNLADLKSQQKNLRSTGYGAIVNSFTEGFPARLGTALSYKTIGVTLNTIRDSLSSMTELQQQFAAVYAITNTTEASMEKLRDTIFDVGNSSSYAAEQIAEATITLGQAGLGAEQIVDALEAVNNLAVGTSTDLATSVNVLTSSLSVWNQEASRAAHVSDVLTTAANRTRADVGTMANAIQYAGAAASDLGVSFEEFTAVASAVTNAGLKARSVVGTGFRSVLTELVDPSAKLRKVFEQLGVSLEDVDVRSRGLTNVLQTLKDAGLDAAMAFQGFDRRAASFFIAATSQLDTVNKLRDAFLQEGAAQKAAEKQMNTFNSQFNRLSNTMKQAFSEAFRPFLAILTQMMEWLADFNSTKIGQWITQITSVSIAILAIKNAVTGLVKAFQSLKAIKLLVIAATNEYTAAQKTETAAETTAAATSKATAGALTTVGTAAKGAATGVKIFGLTLKSILVTTVVGAAIVALTHLISSIKSTEEVFDEANNKIKESEDRVKSLESAYDELVEKQKLYREDSDALIIRGREINNQFDLQGALILKASDSLENYLENLRLAIKLEKEKQLMDKKILIESLPQVIEENGKLRFFSDDPRNRSLWGGMAVQRMAKARGMNWRDESDITDYLFKLAGEGEYSELYKIRDEFTQIVGDILKDEKDSKRIRSVTDKFYSRINDVVQYTAAKNDVDLLQKELINWDKSSKTLIALDTDLQHVRDAFSKNLGKATNVETYKEMATGLLELKEEVERERISRKEDLDRQITEAKEQGLTDTVEQLTKRQNAFNLLYGENLNTVDTKIKEALDKRVQMTGKALQDYSKAIENGETGDSVEKQRKKLENLTSEFSQAVDLQEKYEKSIIDRIEQLRKEGLNKDINAERKKLEKLNAEFGTTNDLSSAMDVSIKMNEIMDNIADLERQRDKGTAVYNAALTAIKNKYDPLRAERFSRAYAAESKSQSSVGTTFGSLLPYTASLYGGSKSGGFKALEESYKRANVYGDSGVARMLGSGTLSRGSILYGQELWGDEKNRRFMDDAWAETGLKGIQTFTDGFTDAVTQFANGAKTFKDALKDFATSSLQTIGNWIIQMSVKAMAMLAIKSMFPEFFGVQVYSEPIGPTQVPNAGGFYGRGAAGGAVSGGIPNRDSVNTKLMPGEYVLKKSAVDYLGKNFLNALNANTAQTMSAVSGDIIAGDNSPASVVNVWVVSDEEEAGMGPNDVIATITKDIRNGGQTRQLIKSIVAGRK